MDFGNFVAGIVRGYDFSNELFATGNNFTEIRNKLNKGYNDRIEFKVLRLEPIPFRGECRKLVEKLPKFTFMTVYLVQSYANLSPSSFNAVSCSDDEVVLKGKKKGLYFARIS